MLKKLLCLFIIFSLVGCKSEEKKKYSIVTTQFVAYDFVKQIVGDDEDFSIKYLLKPGSETHDYEPTPRDMVSIKEADLFIYNGGESDEWVEEMSDDLNVSHTLKLMDVVSKTYEEEESEGMESHEEEEEEAYDEHVWTSPKNAIDIVNALTNSLYQIKSNDQFKINSNEYINEIKKIDTKIKEVIKKSQRKTIVFGDRFPLLYFVKEYGLDYRAAFPGCSEQTEPSAKTISYLIDYVKENNIPVIFKLELSNGNIARTIAEETNTKVLTFNAVHNISADDFNNNKGYIDLMNENIKVLKEALQ